MFSSTILGITLIDDILEWFMLISAKIRSSKVCLSLWWMSQLLFFTCCLDVTNTQAKVNIWLQNIWKSAPHWAQTGRKQRCVEFCNEAGVSLVTCRRVSFTNVHFRGNLLTVARGGASGGHSHNVMGLDTQSCMSVSTNRCFIYDPFIFPLSLC